MVDVLSAVAVIPSAPVMVPELASGTAAELAALREAVTWAASELPMRWIGIGVGRCDAVIGPRALGTFAGYGVDVRVALSPGAEEPVAALPLCALITGWVRGRARPTAQVQMRVYADAHRLDAALARGAQLRAEIEEAADEVGVLVVADGLHTLSLTAPGGYDPDSIPRQDALDDALAAGDAAALTRLPGDVVGRVAYQVLAGLAGAPRSAEQRYRGAPYGVGYFAGVWRT